MIRDPQVTQVYSQAFFRVAKKRAATAALLEETREILSLAGQDPRIRVFFLGLHVPTQAKINVAERVFRPRFHPLLTDFVLYLIQKGRIDYFRDILERFQVHVETDQGIFPAKVTTARESSPAEKEHLQASLEQFSGCKLRITHVCNPAILGGVIFAFQDTFVDDSLRGHLKRLRDQLLAVSVY